MKMSTTKKHKGVAMVEFAIILPFIFILLYSIVEVSRLQLTVNSMAKSVRDGARYLANNSELGDTGTVVISSEDETITKNLVVYGAPNNTGTPIIGDLTTDNVSVIDMGDNTHVRVTATINYAPILDGSFDGFGLFDEPVDFNFPISVTSTMRSLE
jgi:Flp pilus assembly protein TadG